MSSGYMEVVFIYKTENGRLTIMQWWFIYTLRMVSWLPYNDDSKKDFIKLETINTEVENHGFLLCVFG